MRRGIDPSTTERALLDLMHLRDTVIRHRVKLLLACAMLVVSVGADATVPSQVFRRFVDLGLRDDVAAQTRLVDSLVRVSAVGSDGRALATILQARMAIVNGMTDEAATLLAPLHFDEASEPTLLFAYAETKSNLHRAKREWVPALA